MKRLRNLVGFCLLVGFSCFSGCSTERESQPSVLKIGMILPLSGPGQAWGEASLHCAQATADYYNAQGGLEIDGERYRIELVVEDDALDTRQSVDAAQRLITNARVKYIIGPFGGDSVYAVAPILDAARVVYFHYGSHRRRNNDRGYGISCLPPADVALPVMFDYLMQDAEYLSAVVLARGTPEGIRQKNIAEQLARSSGLEVVRYSTFDVTEETVSPNSTTAEIVKRLGRLVDVAPGVVVLVDIPPGEMDLVLAGLQAAGFDGVVAAQNRQEPSLFTATRSDVDLVYFGGDIAVDGRSDYYHQLKEQVKEQIVWTSEVDRNLYVMEVLLRTLQMAGVPALEDTYVFIESVGEAPILDPFYSYKRELRFGGVEAFSDKRQLAIPISLTHYQDGAARCVRLTDSQ